MRGGIAEKQGGEQAGVKPLPTWFFVFEGSMGAVYDLCQAWDRAWLLFVALGAVNAVVGLTVLRSRVKLVRAMLKNARTRKIALGLVTLRLGAHLALVAAGAPITSTAGHLAMGLVMVATTVGLLWFDQRVTFRALGLLPAAPGVGAAPEARGAGRLPAGHTC